MKSNHLTKNLPPVPKPGPEGLDRMWLGQGAPCASWIQDRRAHTGATGNTNSHGRDGYLRQWCPRVEEGATKPG